MKTIILIALVATAFAVPHKQIGDDFRTCEKACIDSYQTHMLSTNTQDQTWESTRFGYEEYQNCRFGTYSSGHLNITLRYDWADKYLSDWTKLEYQRLVNAGVETADTAKYAEYEAYVHAQEELAKKEGHFVEQEKQCMFLDQLPGEEYDDVHDRINQCHNTCTYRDGSFDSFSQSFVIDGTEKFQSGFYGECKARCEVKYNFDVSQRDSRDPDYEHGQCQSKCEWEWDDKATETEEQYRQYWQTRIMNCTLNLDEDNTVERYSGNIQRKGLKPIAQCYRFRDVYWQLDDNGESPYEMKAFDQQFWSDYLSCENFCMDYEQVEKYNKGNATDYLEYKGCTDGCRDTWLSSRGFVSDDVKTKFAAGASIQMFAFALCFIALFALL